MWTDTHFYKFPDETTFQQHTWPEGAAIDLVGTLYSNTANEAPLPVAGFHVNARWWVEEPAAWAAYRLPAPQFPRREFA